MVRDMDELDLYRAAVFKQKPRGRKPDEMVDALAREAIVIADKDDKPMKWAAGAVVKDGVSERAIINRANHLRRGGSKRLRLKAVSRL